jgi:hypothetical protein
VSLQLASRADGAVGAAVLGSCGAAGVVAGAVQRSTGLTAWSALVLLTAVATALVPEPGRPAPLRTAARPRTVALTLCFVAHLLAVYAVSYGLAGLLVTPPPPGSSAAPCAVALLVVCAPCALRSAHRLLRPGAQGTDGTTADRVHLSTWLVGLVSCAALLALRTHDNHWADPLAGLLVAVAAMGLAHRSLKALTPTPG